jgi:hypothetical protein
MREIFKYGSVGGALGDRRIYPDRAKVNPRPWDWEKSHEIGYCYPVGASAGLQGNPT